LLRTPHDNAALVLEPADSASPDATPVAADPFPVAQAQVWVPNPLWRPELASVPIALAGLGVAAVASLAFGALRMRRFRPLPQEPENDVLVEGGFAEAQLAHDLTRGLRGVSFDPVEALVRQLEQFLAEYNLTRVDVVSVRHGRSSTSISLRCGLAEQAILVDLASVFAERLEAEAEASVSADQDVLLRLSRLRKARLLPAVDARSEGAWLVPLGVLYDRQVYAAAWSSLGHALVVSLPGHGADTILTSLVATLTARRSPEQLRLWMFGSRRALPAPLFELPHLARVVDPGDNAALAAAVDELRAELDRRATHRPAHDLLIVVPELANLGEHAASLALLAGHAAELGVRLVAASTSPEEALASPLTGQFTTRMVLRMQNDEASVALLGVADAAFVGGGGRLLLRVDGRQPVELYGYQVTSEHLERLVKVMRSAYAPSPGPDHGPAIGNPPAATPSDAEPATEAEPSDSRLTDAEPASMQEQSTALPLARAQVEAETASSVLQVMCLGNPRVYCGAEQVWPRQSGDAKPWEFLFYLACQPAEGVSRERAVEALWPDDQVDDAAHRFRQLRYRLRRVLAHVPGAPPTDGVCLDRAKMRLDPGVIYSDAQEFLTLARNVNASPSLELIERLERARALYVGDLLEGPDVHRYAWIHERDESGVTVRQHFRRLFEQATLRLAELYAAAGRLETAVALYRQLTDMDPADEQLWLALFRMDALRGDRLALIRDELHYREALRELAEDLGCVAGERIEEPSREVAQEFQRLLTSLHERDREPASA
jgi:DNA-binding SARP family transcriptional activator